MEGICFLACGSWTKHAIRVYVGTGAVSQEQDNGQVPWRNAKPLGIA